MKYFRLILKNALRNRRRTLLTILSVGVSLFLLVSLRTLLRELEWASYLTEESGQRLVTRHAVSLGVMLPLAYGQRIEQVAGVKYVMPLQWFGGVYVDPDNFFPQLGVDAERVFQIAVEYTIPPEQLEAFKKERRAAVAGRRLAERFGWKLGDRITLQGTLWPLNLELILRGIYTGPDESGLYFHYDYLNEALRARGSWGTDRAGSFWILVETPEQVPRVAQTIDAMFRNSEAPTKTETEKAFALSFTAMLGNVKLFVTLISTAVVFAILLVTANTMAMSVRERTSEIGVLKTLGFRRGQVLGLLVGEALLISGIGGVLGCFGARLCYAWVDMNRLTQGFFQTFTVDAGTIGLGLGVALLLGLVSAAIPALGAARLAIASALRHTG